MRQALFMKHVATHSEKCIKTSPFKTVKYGFYVNNLENA